MPYQREPRYLENIKLTIHKRLRDGSLTLDSPINNIPYLGTYLSNLIVRELRVRNLRQLLVLILGDEHYNTKQLRTLLSWITRNRHMNQCLKNYHTRDVNKYGFSSLLYILRQLYQGSRVRRGIGSYNLVYRTLRFAFTNPNIMRVKFPSHRNRNTARCSCFTSRRSCERSEENCLWNRTRHRCTPRDSYLNKRESFEGFPSRQGQYLDRDEVGADRDRMHFVGPWRIPGTIRRFPPFTMDMLER
jgi:hypothetical protein